MFDMRRLRHALALAEHRNFARAAAALHITQPALSRSIQALEEGMGVLLFDRSPRDVEPTAFGELVLRHARGLELSSRDLDREPPGRPDDAGQPDSGIVEARRRRRRGAGDLRGR